MANALQMYLPLTKVDAVNRLVYGIATEEMPDRVREIFDYEKSKPYYEEWSSEIAKASGGQSLGNVRAMHSKIAAGKLTELTFNDAQKRIEVCAKIVDDNEWNKVVEGVYTGFSQGGDYVDRFPDPRDPTLKRYVARPTELSLVDLPCLPSATFQLIKSAGAVQEVEVRTFKSIANEEGVNKAFQKFFDPNKGFWSQIQALEVDEQGKPINTGDTGKDSQVGVSSTDNSQTTPGGLAPSPVPIPATKAADGDDDKEGSPKEEAGETAAEEAAEQKKKKQLPAFLQAKEKKVAPAPAPATKSISDGTYTLSGPPDVMDDLLKDDRYSGFKEVQVSSSDHPKDGAGGHGRSSGAPSGSYSTPGGPSIEEGGFPHPSADMEDETNEDEVEEEGTAGSHEPKAQAGTEKPTERATAGRQTPSHVQETSGPPRASKAANGDGQAEIPSSVNAVAQVWLAKDGTPFQKKADAITHNEKLELEESQRAAAAPATAALDALKAALDRIDGGEVAIENAQAFDKAWQQTIAERQAQGGVQFWKVYSSVDEIPPAVKQHFKDEKKQRQWMHVWNSVYKDSKDEQKAFAQAWAATEKATETDLLKLDKKPYGDVEYADPGHQSDGKKRYPLDTEKHVRAAWSYIHMPKNASKYKSNQLASVKSKIAAAFKRVTGHEPPSSGKLAPIDLAKMMGDQLSKHLYDVGDIACTILKLNDMKQCLEMEAVREGDSPQLAIELEMNIASLCEFLKNLVQEETAELVAGTEDLTAHDDDGDGALTILLRQAVGPNAAHLHSVMMKAFGDEILLQEAEAKKRRKTFNRGPSWPFLDALEKVGRKMGQINRMHLQSAHDHIAAMSGGAVCDEDGAAKMAKWARLEKAGAKLSRETMDKAQSIHDGMSDLGADCSMGKAALLRSTDEEVTSFEKARGFGEGALARIVDENAALKGALTKVTDGIEILQKRILKLEKEPLPAKGFKRVMPGSFVAMEKGADSGELAIAEFSHEGLRGQEALDAFTRYLETLPEQQRQLELIKIAQRNPKIVVNSGPPWMR
jgi:hypothetical protein